MCEERKLYRNRLSIQKINLEQFVIIKKQLSEGGIIIKISMAENTMVF